MNLSQLYYFRKLAELQHYTRAAKELFITQPTLSGSISSLEQELGISLFQKAGRNVELTKYGAEFLIYVNAALEQLDKGVAIMKSYSGESDGGTIDLGCVITLQTDYIPCLLNGYRAFSDHQYEFNISQKPSQLLLDSLNKGVYDVVFCACNDKMDHMVSLPVVAQKFVVAMSNDSPLAGKDYLVPDDLKGHELISYRDDIPLGSSVKRFLSKCDIDNVKYSYEDESILAGFAANGPSVALMLDTFFLRNVNGVVVRPFYNNEKEKREFCHVIYLVYSEKNYHPYCVDNFIDYVKENQLDTSDPHYIFFD